MKWRLPVVLQLNLAHKANTALLQVLVPIVQVKQIIVINRTFPLLMQMLSFAPMEYY